MCKDCLIEVLGLFWANNQRWILVIAFSHLLSFDGGFGKLYCFERNLLHFDTCSQLIVVVNQTMKKFKLHRTYSIMVSVDVYLKFLIHCDTTKTMLLYNRKSCCNSSFEIDPEAEKVDPEGNKAILWALNTSSWFSLLINQSRGDQVLLDLTCWLSGQIRCRVYVTSK